MSRNSRPQSASSTASVGDRRLVPIPITPAPHNARYVLSVVAAREVLSVLRDEPGVSDADLLAEIADDLYAPRELTAKERVLFDTGLLITFEMSAGERWELRALLRDQDTELDNEYLRSVERTLASKLSAMSKPRGVSDKHDKVLEVLDLHATPTLEVSITKETQPTSRASRQRPTRPSTR